VASKWMPQTDASGRARLVINAHKMGGRFLESVNNAAGTVVDKLAKGGGGTRKHS